ncbi:MAG: hypothetical protein KBC22_01060 [Candidatus Pacebacteria bacterium]|nr:hypothetical protein [Candidatus Paceibacterota bacterium]
MKSIALTISMFLTALFVFGQEVTDTATVPQKKVTFSVTGNVTFANTNEAPRVGKIIGPYGLNITPFVQLNMKTRKTAGWYCWVFKSVTPTHIDQPGNYLQFAMGKQIKIGKYVILDPHASYFIPQEEYFFKNDQTTWIFALLAATHVSRKSANNPNETHMVNVFINRFENTNGSGSGWSFRLAWKKSIKYALLEVKTWYNDGLFNTDPGFNGAITVMTNRYAISKRMYIQGTVTGFVNFTRNTDNPFTNDAGVVGLVVGYQ